MVYSPFYLHDGVPVSHVGVARLDDGVVVAVDDLVQVLGHHLINTRIHLPEQVSTRREEALEISIQAHFKLVCSWHLHGPSCYDWKNV